MLDLDNPVYPPRTEETADAKSEQPSRNDPKVNNVITVIVDLPRNVNVHAPHTSDDIHRQHDGANDGEFAKNIGVLFGSLVHADVDLGYVVAVGPGK